MAKTLHTNRRALSFTELRALNEPARAIKDMTDYVLSDLFNAAGDMDYSTLRVSIAPDSLFGGDAKPDHLIFRAEVQS